MLDYIVFGAEFPVTLHNCFVTFFVLIVVFIVTLPIGMYIYILSGVKRFIKLHNLSKTSNFNVGRLWLHVFMNVTQYLTLFLISYVFLKLTDPT